MLTRNTFVGPWAGLPVAWNPNGEFDEATYREDVTRCCIAGMPGVYTGGTTGEFYAMELDEFRQVADATVETCHAHNVPAMVGCSSTYTLGVIRRARHAAKIGADAIQVALPFWMEVADDQIVSFFRDVSESCGHLPLSIYETTRAKRVLTLEQHRAIHAAVPNYLMVKSNAKTLGAMPEGCAALSAFVNVFVGEDQWAALVPHGACGGCSSAVYWNPRVILSLWSAIRSGDAASAKTDCDRIDALFQFLHQEFGSRGFTDTAFDRLGGVASGFLKTNLTGRLPYPSATSNDVAKLRNWYQTNFSEMLVHD